MENKNLAKTGRTPYLSFWRIPIVFKLDIHVESSLNNLVYSNFLYMWANSAMFVLPISWRQSTTNWNSPPLFAVYKTQVLNSVCIDCHICKMACNFQDS